MTENRPNGIAQTRKAKSRTMTSPDKGAYPAGYEPKASVWASFQGDKA